MDSRTSASRRGFRRIALTLTLPAALALALIPAGSRAQTYYVDSPGASDAQKIATSMLNDAAAKSARAMRPWNATPNPFTQMIEQYEARQRARSLEMEAAAQEARQRQAERAAEERAWREEQARMERTRREVAHFEAVQKEALDLNPMAHVRLGMMVESGRADSDVVALPPGMTPRAFVLQRYAQAANLDLPLGKVAHICLHRQLSPAFPAMWEALQAFDDPSACRSYLERLAGGGHVGAAYWLGAWAAGQDVGLGSFPPLPGNASSREYALEWLARADPQRLGALRADLILRVEPESAARREAVALLERLAVRGDDGDADAFIFLARELFERARFESDMERPRALLGVFRKADLVPGMTALASMHLDGKDGLFRPGAAAQVYRRMPEKPRFLALRAKADILEGIDAILGVERSVDVASALQHFEAAERALASLPGVYRAEDTGLKVEATLWRQFARAEAGVTGSGLEDPVEFLMEHANSGRGLGRLLFRCAFLGRTTTSAITANSVWAMIRTDSPFTAPLSPAEVVLYLRCAIRAHDRGGAPELAPVVASLRNLPPREAPIRGAAALTQLAFIRGTLGRDAANRRGLADAYAALFRASWRDPGLWGETAALVEVLQIDPLDASEWSRGWLAPWLADASDRGREARAWAEVLRKPGAAAWKEASGRPWGRLVESLLGDSVPALTPPVAALRDSLQLRSVTDGAAAEAAFRSLLGLAREGHWHAQALLEDFETRYYSAYVKASATRLFREHAREVAEAFVAWRTQGFGFCRVDREARMRAMGRALEAGSIRFSRATLEEAAEVGSEAARVALLRLKAVEAVPGAGRP